MAQKKTRETVRDEKQTVRVVIELACNDEKLALTTSTDGVIIKDQCARLQNEPGKLNISIDF